MRVVDRVDFLDGKNWLWASNMLKTWTVPPQLSTEWIFYEKTGFDCSVGLKYAKNMDPWLKYWQRRLKRVHNLF